MLALFCFLSFSLYIDLSLGSYIELHIALSFLQMSIVQIKDFKLIFNVSYQNEL